MGPTALPIVWAQASETGTTAPPSSLAALALRRWFASLTLSSPEAVPSLFGLWSWLLGLAALLVVAILFQGPGRALGQLFDPAGHVRLGSQALGRLRRSGRMVAVTIGATVLAWTASQAATYRRPQGKDDLALLTKARTLGALAVEQGIMAALTPLRDLCGLADNLPLLIGASVLAFRAASDRWGGATAPASAPRPPVSGWVHVVWGCGALLLLYRIAALIAGMGDLPLGGCLMIEPPLVPALMLLCDGVLLAYVLVELRNADLGATGAEALDLAQVVGLMPGAALACLAALPARAVATGILLAWLYVPDSAGATVVGRYLRWQLNWGLADLQGAALVVVGLAGAVARSRGTLGGAVRGYVRLLADQGGRLVVVLALAGFASGLLSALAYLVVLSLPASTWVLAAADSYAHYATLPVGLWTLAALVELGERSRPAATSVEVNAVPGGTPA
ncbi:MAG TPA: hypothetical protein VKP69_32480 [Isosphaeraceae bacterium]|nr:hypothetical protein [Isosphaeraceae bacterium]